MMRFVFGLLVIAGFLVSSPACAQSLDSPSGEGVPLRLVFRSEFLPEGTEVVVLRSRATEQIDGRYQPQMMASSAFPRSMDAFFRRDALDAEGRTARQYTPTPVAGDLYFLYALDDDGTLYWSYSALRDSIKFDAVEKGVMSVAPITDGNIARQVRDQFFDGNRMDVVVSGLDQGVSDDAPQAMETTAPARTSTLPNPVPSTPAAASADTMAMEEQAAEERRDPSRLVPPSDEMIEAQARAARPGGVWVPTWLFWTALVLVLGMLLAAVHFALKYRQETIELRQALMNARLQAVSRNFGRGDKEGVSP